MSSPARPISSAGKFVAAFPDVSDLPSKIVSPIARAGSGLTAFSFEFVAKPEQAGSAVRILPGEIHSGLEDLAGFLGSLVMVSDQEARLITVIVFWSGAEARRSCERSLRRVHALLAPYLDRCLRVQNLLAHFPAEQEGYSQASSIDTRLITDDSIVQEANVCVA